MSTAEYIDLCVNLSGKSEAGFYRWFRSKYGMVVTKHNDDISGKVVYRGQTIESHNKERNNVARCIAKSIMQTIAESHNYYIPHIINSVDIMINEENVFIVMMGNCTINDVYKFEETRHGFNQLVLHRIGSHLDAFPEPIQIPGDGVNWGDDFLDLCTKDIAKGVNIMVYKCELIYFCFTDIVTKPRNIIGNIKFIPFNIYDFIEVMTMLGTKLSSNLLQIRNKDSALGYCFEYIDIGVD